MENHPSGRGLTENESVLARAIIDWLDQEKVTTYRIAKDGDFSKCSIRRYRRGEIPHIKNFEKLVSFAYALGCPFVYDEFQMEMPHDIDSI